MLDKALKTIPDALAVLKDQRDNLAEALDQLGKFSALTADSVNQTKDNLVKELKDLGPVLESLANAGPALTRSLSCLPPSRGPRKRSTNWVRGDYAQPHRRHRLDAEPAGLRRLFTGTRWEGNLTELEMQWGRTIGQLPSPYTAGNPLVAALPLRSGTLTCA